MTASTASIRKGAAIGIAGAAMTSLAGIAVQAIVQPATDVSDRLWRYPWSATAFIPVSLLYAALHVLVIVGLLALMSSGATGAGRTGRRGVTTAVVGTALLLVGELASLPIRHATVHDTSAGVVGAVFGLGCLVSAVGFLIAGFAIVRAGSWEGWHRWTAVIAGIWTAVLVGLAPTKALPGGVAVYGVCVLLLFVATRAETAVVTGRRQSALQAA